MSLSISCNDCAMHGTDACADCVVTFVLGAEASVSELELADDHERVVQLFSKAGLVPLLKYRAAS